MSDRSNNRVEIPNRLTGPGILMRTLRKGDGRNVPKKGDIVRVNYDAFLWQSDGQLVKIDPSQEENATNLPYEFELGAEQVIEGWEVAVSSMSVGQEVEITIPPLYAYHTAGCPPTIPPGATLLYRLELCKVVRNEDKI